MGKLSISESGKHFPLSKKHKGTTMALRCVFGRRSLLLSLKPQVKLGFCGDGVTVRNHSDHVEAGVREESPQPHPFVIHPRHAVVSYYRNPLSDGKNGGAGGITPFYGSLSDPEVVEPSLSAIEQYNKQQNKKLKFVGLLEAFFQIVCGRKFYLTVEALDAGVLNKYKVEITRNASKKCALELNSFKLVADSHET